VRNPDARLGFDINLAHIKVHQDASTFPEGVFNPAWEAEVEAAKQAVVQPLVSSEREVVALAQAAATVETKPDFDKTWNASLQCADQRSEYVKRIEGVVSPNLREKTILCIGTGGGSYFIEKLARYMPKKLILIDPDTVSISNLCRTNFAFSDATENRFKVDALSERVLHINPFIEIERHTTIMANMTEAELQAIVVQADLIVEGTDNFASKKLVNELARAYEKPALYIGVHVGAQSGRIVWSYPSVSSCYECVAQDRYRAAEAALRDTTAAPLNLDAQHGSVVDIQLIDMVSLRVTLAMLEAGQDSVMGRFFEHLQERGNDLMVRTSLDSPWGSQIFSALLDDLPMKPKPYADELAQYFVGIDVIALPGAVREDCDCQKHKKRLSALYGSQPQDAYPPVFYL
jgi:molybdopterin/thiamine biosynthesis adenylyltransferase